MIMDIALKKIALNVATHLKNAKGAVIGPTMLIPAKLKVSQMF